MLLPFCSNPELKKSLDQVKERYTKLQAMVSAMLVLAVLPKTSALYHAGHKASLKLLQRLLKWPKMPQVSSKNEQAR